jgi:hypothetical protein
MITVFSENILLKKRTGEWPIFLKEEKGEEESSL